MVKPGIIKTVLAAIALVVALSSQSYAQPPYSFADLAEGNSPSVINIYTTKMVKGRSPLNPFKDFRGFFDDDMYKKFFGDDKGKKPPEFKARSLGSGFFWNKDGYIVTNNHVIEGAEEISIRTINDKVYEAEIVGTDPDTDLALLKIKELDNGDLKPVTLGDSDKLRVGDWVMAIGNPSNLGHTVTAGIVSAKGRDINAGPYDSFIQTDADINPGNSGGPLFNMEGLVVGVNSMKIQKVGVSGIGFAIPINRAREVISQLIESGKVTRGWLGVSVQPVTEELAESLDLPEAKGALVGGVFKGSPAEKAGLERGDVIIGFGGVKVEKQGDLPYLVARKAPGTEVEVEVLRSGNKKVLIVTLTERTKDSMNGKAIDDAGKEKEFGLSIQEITPELSAMLDLKSDTGVVVTNVELASPAQEAGIRRGDVIVEINKVEVTDLETFRGALTASSKKNSTLMVVMRGRNTSYVVVKHQKEEE